MTTTATAIPFARLFRAEFRKAADTRAARWLLAAAVLLALAAQAVPLVFPRDVTQDRASFLTWAALGLSRLLPIALMLTMTAEWSQRTALTTFTLEPRRGRVLAAKVAASLAISVIGGCLASRIAQAGWPWRSPTDATRPSAGAGRNSRASPPSSFSPPPSAARSAARCTTPPPPS